MNVSPDPPRKEAPWMAGLRAARANIIPALIVQSVMLAVVLLYYHYPPTRDLLNHLADLKERWSYGYSALAGLIAGGLVPEIMRILVFQKGRVLRENFLNLRFTVPYWAASGAIVDLFYRFQGQWFGAEVSLGVVAIKVLVDQFLFNPLWAAPTGAWFYDWKNGGCSFKGTGRFFTAGYYRDVVVPLLFATWGVWIPLVAIIYSLPSLLQIPLFALALAMWVMLFTWISEARMVKT